MINAIRLLLSLVFLPSAIFQAKAGAPINYIGYATASAPVFSKAGPTKISYQLYDTYTGIHKPGAALSQGSFTEVRITDSSNNVLYSYDVTSITGGLGYVLDFPHLLTTGSFIFPNPTDQYLILHERIIWHTAPLWALPGWQTEEWTAASGQSVVSGGDTPGKPPGGIGGGGGGSIHAVIISGRSDPAKDRDFAKCDLDRRSRSARERFFATCRADCLE